MKPDASTHNPDPDYCRALVESTGMNQPDLAKQIGLTDRTLRRYMSGERPFPYHTQFLLESIVLEP